MYNVLQEKSIDDCRAYESLTVSLEDGTVALATVSRFDGQTKLELQIVEPDQLELPLIPV